MNPLLALLLCLIPSLAVVTFHGTWTPSTLTLPLLALVVWVAITKALPLQIGWPTGRDLTPTWVRALRGVAHLSVYVSIVAAIWMAFTS